MNNLRTGFCPHDKVFEAAVFFSALDWRLKLEEDILRRSLETKKEGTVSK